MMYDYETHVLDFSPSHYSYTFSCPSIHLHLLNYIPFLLPFLYCAKLSLYHWPITRYPEGHREEVGGAGVMRGVRGHVSL